MASAITSANGSPSIIEIVSVIMMSIPFPIAFATSKMAGKYERSRGQMFRRRRLSTNDLSSFTSIVHAAHKYNFFCADRLIIITCLLGGTMSMDPAFTASYLVMHHRGSRYYVPSSLDRTL